MGAAGWVAWDNTDFALAGQDPYRHHAFELNFGLTTQLAGGCALAELDGTPVPDTVTVDRFGVSVFAVQEGPAGGPSTP